MWWSLMFIRKIKNELGVTLSESLIAMAIAVGAGAAVTPTLIETLNSVEADAQSITMEQIQNLQVQASISGDDVIMSAEDFKELTQDLTKTCNATP